MSTRKRNINPWGYHLTLDAGSCDHEAIRSKETIAAFTKELIQKIKMVAYGNPRIVMFGEGDKKGYTLVQLIETSDITAHFVEETDAVYLDLFSCKKYDPLIAIAVFKKYFNPKTLVKRFVKRLAKGPKSPKGQKRQTSKKARKANKLTRKRKY